MRLSDSATQFPKLDVQPEIWETLTQKELSSNFNYYTSFAFSEFIEILNLPHVDPCASAHRDDLFDVLEDEELAKALDHHSIITSQLPDDCVQTADEIIEEIDRLMIDDETELDLDLCDPQATAEYRSAYVWKSVSVLKQMSITQLNSLVDELDACIRHHSARLVQELATREELDYEQEVKDIFFTRLHEVQGRMDEWAKCNSFNNELCTDDDVIKDCGGEKKQGLFKGANSAAAKAILANAALAVRRRWRRMGRSLEKARSSLRRRTQPIDPRDVSSDQVAGKMCVSNSNIELTSEDASTEDEWCVRRSGSHSAATTPTAGATSAGHSPRRHHVWLTAASLSTCRRNPEEDLKFLSTKIPYHRSSSFDGGCEGPTVGHLELFNEFLLCMLTNNPNLTPLLTDYILNVYAPSEKTIPKLVI
uniref:Fasciculation and elongation protein zeta-2 n=1 Tax=Mesocestoides corti TaxID=53468 RepID=A0A5K3FP23_MESCO